MYFLSFCTHKRSIFIYLYFIQHTADLRYPVFDTGIRKKTVSRYPVSASVVYIHIQYTMISQYGIPPFLRNPVRRFQPKPDSQKPGSPPISIHRKPIHRNHDHASQNHRVRGLNVLLLYYSGGGPFRGGAALDFFGHASQNVQRTDILLTEVR